MALYDTKKAFSGVTVFGDSVQKQKKKVFGYFFQRQEADTHFTTRAGIRLWERCAPALVCRYDKPDVRREYAQERRRLCQKERKDSLLRRSWLLPLL